VTRQDWQLDFATRPENFFIVAIVLVGVLAAVVGLFDY
jgi:hypothetical protein